VPIGSEKGFRGVVDLVAMKAHIYKPDGDGKPSIEEIPPRSPMKAKEAHEKLVEMIAEGDDEMMEEFFREGTIPIHDLIPAVRKASLRKKYSRADDFRDPQYRYRQPAHFPSPMFSRIPDEHAQVGFKEPGGKGDRVERKYDDSQPLSLFVFKTLSDPFTGRINYSNKERCLEK